MSWQMWISLLCMAQHFSSTLADDHIELKLGVESDLQHLPCYQWKYYKVDVTEACKDLSIMVKHEDGEPDVYVSRGATTHPTERSLTWSSYNWGSEHLIISSWDPEFIIGTFYIGVHAYCGADVGTGYSDTQYTVLVESVESVHPHEEISLNGLVTGKLQAQGYQYFRFCIPDSCVKVEVKLDNCIDPVACPSTYSWPELLVSRSIMAPTINDHSWKLAAIERRSVYIDHDDPEFYPGHYFVGVYGWCTPAEHCPDVSDCGPCTNYETNFNVSVIVDGITPGCEPKKPLGLCEGGGSPSVMTTASLTVLVLAMFLAVLVSSF